MTTTTLTSPTDHFVDGGDGTLTDSETRLSWEKKDTAGGSHDVDNSYAWAGLCQGGVLRYCQPTAAAAELCASHTGGAIGCALCDGPCLVHPSALTTAWDWLAQLNADRFAGHSDWRLPTATDGPDGELNGLIERSAANFPPDTPSVFKEPCDAGCSVLACSCTETASYWSASTLENGESQVRVVNFSFGTVGAFSKEETALVRAVRGP